MGDAIDNSKFNYIFIQFYNNYPCSAYQFVRPDGGAGDGFNFDAWETYVSSHTSAGAKLLVGLPASLKAANTAEFFLSPSELTSLVTNFASHTGFGDIMLWDAGNSDSESNGGCTYDQEVRSMLDNGHACWKGNLSPVPEHEPVISKDKPSVSYCPNLAGNVHRRMIISLLLLVTVNRIYLYSSFVVKAQFRQCKTQNRLGLGISARAFSLSSGKISMQQVRSSWFELLLVSVKRLSPRDLWNTQALGEPLVGNRNRTSNLKAIQISRM